MKTEDVKQFLKIGYGPREIFFNNFDLFLFKIFFKFWNESRNKIQYKRYTGFDQDNELVKNRPHIG